MSIKHVSIEQLKALQHNTDNIRNVCILAHVDHGKTTLADCLISSNGIISSKMAGKLRYMDSRKDEQERGITMKSSSISLYYKSDEEKEYLVNLIDSPGHVDFSSEVSTAVRLCDGAIIVVDCVEGVCAQTQVSLKQAWLEKISPILVLNKIDRLILEMQLTPLDIYVHLAQLVEQVNAVMGELFASQVMDEQADRSKEKEAASENSGIYTDWGTGLEEADDSDLYFSPDRGNVVFASAFDGWGFTLDDFARMYSAKLGIKEALLRKTLWGDFYLNSKARRIMRGAQAKAKTPLFVDFVLKNLVTLYETIAVRKDKEKLTQIATSLGVKLLARDLRHTDPRVTIQAVMTAWLPLSRATLNTLCVHCPAPNHLTEEKVEKLLSTSHIPFNQLPPESKLLKAHFLQCSPGPKAHSTKPNDCLEPIIKAHSPEAHSTKPKVCLEPGIKAHSTEAHSTKPEDSRDPGIKAQSPEAHSIEPADEAHSAGPGPPLVVFISKMFPVERKHLPENRVKPLTREEMDARREAVKSRLAAKLEAATHTNPDAPSSVPAKSHEPRTPDQKDEEAPATVAEPEDAFIAFARVFSGTVRKGDTVYVLGPKHDPGIVLDKLASGEDLNLDGQTLKDLKAGCHVTKVTLNQIYLLMGRELCELDEVPAGNMLGIGGLEEHVLKSATLSSELACPSFSELLLMAMPILRVAVEPVQPSDLATLVRGLRLLNQADACVEVILQETGEHVLVTAGEVHLQRCLDDLRDRYARVQFSVSEPIVPFRETVVTPPLVDMINESIVPAQHEKKDHDSSETQPWVTVHTQDHSYRFRIQAMPLPEKITQLLDRNTATLKAFHRDTRLSKKLPDLEASMKALTVSTSPKDLSQDNQPTSSVPLHDQTPASSICVNQTSSAVKDNLHSGLIENNHSIEDNQSRITDDQPNSDEKTSYSQLTNERQFKDAQDSYNDSPDSEPTSGSHSTSVVSHNKDSKSISRNSKGNIDSKSHSQDSTSSYQDSKTIVDSNFNSQDSKSHSQESDSNINSKLNPQDFKSNSNINSKSNSQDNSNINSKSNSQDNSNINSKSNSQDNCNTNSKSNSQDNSNTNSKSNSQDSTSAKENLDASLVEDMLRIRQELRTILREDKDIEGFSEEDLDRVLSFGPRYCGPNVLINCVPDLDHSLWPDSNPRPAGCKDERLEHLSSVVNGFQLASLAGPLCEEPMMGVGFRLLEWSRQETPAAHTNTFYGPISGQIMTTVKEGCRKAFQIQPQRLMAAMYTCNIQVSSEVLGKLYAVLGRRHGRIVYGDVTQGSVIFTVQAYLPVVESFSFAPEIRKSTSGLASPQLVFSHWEVIPIDPFWEPRTEEELVHFGDKADSENRAAKYMNTVRKRKGLAVQDKLVTHGEKQRTMKKNK